MKNHLILSVVAGTWMCWSARGEVTFNGPSDAMGVTSLTNAVRWSDGNLPEDPTVDYRIANGILRTPTYGDYVFKGKSLTIGSTNSTQTAGLAICTWDTTGVRTIEFQNDGLILESGTLSQYNDRGTKIAGKITVAAPASKEFCSGNNQKAEQSGMDGAGLWFTGEVVGEAGTRWRFQRSFYCRKGNRQDLARSAEPPAARSSAECPDMKRWWFVRLTLSLDRSRHRNIHGTRTG